MKKNRLIGTVLVMAAVLGGASAFAKDLPAKFTDFERMTFAEMKALPDVKWPLAKPATSEDLAGKSETELVLLRNSIYAQNGFRFSEKSLANYFLSRKWYKPSMESMSFMKLTPVDKANVQALMKMQATERGIASEDDYYRSQLAYNVFVMGFCTYEVAGNPKAGMVVFEPGGVARVFHSKASQSQFDPYAYENYMLPEIGEMGSLLIQATWSMKITPKSASVLIDYPEGTDRFTDSKGKPIITKGSRLALSVDYTNQGDLYPWVKTRNCTMSIVK